MNSKEEQQQTRSPVRYRVSWGSDKTYVKTRTAQGPFEQRVIDNGIKGVTRYA